MHLFEKKISSEKKFDGILLQVYRDRVELENQSVQTREYIMHPGGACIAPLTKDHEIIFVRQFRYPYGDVILELPAGKLDYSELPEQTAYRELKEETGYDTEEMVFLGEMYPSPGYTDEVDYLYACRVSNHGELELDEDEFLDVVKIPFEEALQMVKDNQIRDAKSQIAILKVHLLMQEGKI